MKDSKRWKPEACQPGCAASSRSPAAPSTPPAALPAASLARSAARLLTGSTCGASRPSSRCALLETKSTTCATWEGGGRGG
jgi:hypothetical protein